MLAGVAVKPLTMHRDARGHVAELFRVDWESELDGFAPAQWHVLASAAGTLRGMHAHARHDDLKIVLHGRVALALKDLRGGSPTEDAAELLELSGDDYVGVLIPAGVAHGVLAHSDSLVLVGVTALYDGSDEYECAWNDAELGIDWPFQPMLLSDRDRRAGTLRELKTRLATSL
jgi:dTDP-4-dehydrorhamnose 3,5-epimerase